jgi:hypothetical protein
MPIVLDGTAGITSPAETIQGNLTTTGNTILGDASTDTLNVGNGGLVKDASGNVGIGTATTYTNSKLAVITGMTVVANNETWYHTNVPNNGTDQKIWRFGGVTSGALAFATVNDAYSSATERMRLDSSGNLGLGVTPSAWSGLTAFEMASGSLSAFSTTELNISQNTFNNGSGWRYKTTAATSQYRQSAGVHSWFNSPSGTAGNAITFTQAMTLDASGNIQLGTATAGAVVPAISIVRGGTTWQLGPSVPSGGGNTFYVLNSSNIGVYLTSGGTSWTASSDERLKTDLKPIENAAEKVSTLRSVTGRFKTDDENVSRSFLIAQDVQAVLPEAVNVQDDEQGTLGVQYTDVIPLLVAAIKELKAEIDVLKASK